jgi:hypothetical protein
VESLRSFIRSGLRCIVPTLGVLIAITCLAPAAEPPQIPPNGLDTPPSHQRLQPNIDDERMPMTPTMAKQNRDLVHMNLEKSKKDASELAALARQLEDELKKQDATTLSADNLYRIERIQKLAKKIRDQMKGF